MKPLKKELIKKLTVASLVFSAIYVALSVTYNLILSNVIYSATILPTITELLVALCEVSSYAVCFAILIYSAYALGSRNAVLVAVVYSAVLLVKNVANIVFQALIFKTGLDLAAILYLLVIWILESALILSVWLIAHLCFKNVNVTEFKLNKIFSKSNPLQVASLFVALLVGATRFIPRLIYDFGYGAPTDIIDLLWIMGAYLSDLIICAIVYFVAFLIIKSLQRENKNEKSF